MHIQAPVEKNYEFTQDGLVLHGNGEGLGAGSEHPTALLRRQEAEKVHLSTTVRLDGTGEAGIAVYQIFCGYATLGLRRNGLLTEAVVHYQVKNLEKEEKQLLALATPSARLEVVARDGQYAFLVDGREISRLDYTLLSTEVAGGFTGVTVGPYCINGKALFEDFIYEED